LKDKLNPFLRELGKIGCHFSLGGSTTHGMRRPRAVTVYIMASAAERWEVTFFDDGSVEIERFASVSGVEDADLEALLAELRADS
jgi:hypothetical protein